MDIRFHKEFKKQYSKLPKKIQQKFDSRLLLLCEDASHPLLNVHTLRGEQWPLMSMNITGDYRALFIQEKSSITFLMIGTHNQLYQ